MSEQIEDQTECDVILLKTKQNNLPPLELKMNGIHSNKMVIQVLFLLKILFLRDHPKQIFIAMAFVNDNSYEN